MSEQRLIEVPKEGIGELSDGYHTFNELYHHRAVLFSVICNAHPELAWKSKLHADGTMYDGMFIVGITTENGDYSYHYDLQPYWDKFMVRELKNAPVWDGHMPSDIDRLYNLPPIEARPVVRGKWGKKELDSGMLAICNQCNYPVSWWHKSKFCPECGADMREVTANECRTVEREDNG